MADIKFGPEWLRQLSGGGSVTSPPPATSVGGKFKLAEHRYGREELLGLLDEKTEAPPELVVYPSICVVGDGQQPMALIPPTEDEQRLFTQSVNSVNPSLRMASRGSGVSGAMRGGRPGGMDRGRGTERGRPGRGRGRGDVGYYTRGTSFDDDFSRLRHGGAESWDDKGREKREESNGGYIPGRGGYEGRGGPPSSPRKPGDYSRGSNWRGADDRPDEDGDWRKPGSTRDHKWNPPRSSWRDRHDDRGPGSDSHGGGGNRGPGSDSYGGGGNFQRQTSYERPYKPAHSRHHEEEKLPEWALDDGEDGGGTFDSSGAFFSLKEIKGNGKSAVNGKKGKEEDKGLGGGDNPSKESASKAGTSCSSKSDQRTIDKHLGNTSDPTTPRNPDTPRDSNPVTPRDPEKSGPDLQRAGPDSRVNNASTTVHSVDNEVRLKAGAEGNRGAEDKAGDTAAGMDFSHLDRVAEEMVANFSDDDVDLGDEALKEVKGAILEQLRKNGEEQGSPELWFYKDPQGDLQGPFGQQEMAEWFSAGYFTMGLEVRRECDDIFKPLEEIIRLWGKIPFVPDNNPPPPPLKVDPTPPADWLRMLQTQQQAAQQQAAQQQAAQQQAAQQQAAQQAAQQQAAQQQAAQQAAQQQAAQQQAAQQQAAQQQAAQQQFAKVYQQFLGLSPEQQVAAMPNLQAMFPEQFTNPTLAQSLTQSNAAAFGVGQPSTSQPSQSMGAGPVPSSALRPQDTASLDMWNKVNNTRLPGPMGAWAKKPDLWEAQQKTSVMGGDRALQQQQAAMAALRQQMETDQRHRLQEVEQQRQLEVDRLRQQELDRLRQQEVERQHLLDVERLRLQEAERQRQEMEAGRMRQQEMEIERKRQMELEMQQEMDRQRQIEADRKRQQHELERQRQMDLERQRQMELERRAQEKAAAEDKARMEAEVQRQREAHEKEMEMYRLQQEQAKQLERERQMEAQRQAEMVRRNQEQLKKLSLPQSAQWGNNGGTSSQAGGGGSSAAPQSLAHIQQAQEEKEREVQLRWAAEMKERQREAALQQQQQKGTWAKQQTAMMEKPSAKSLLEIQEEEAQMMKRQTVNEKTAAAVVGATKTAASVVGSSKTAASVVAGGAQPTGGAAGVWPKTGVPTPQAATWASGGAWGPRQTPGPKPTAGGGNSDTVFPSLSAANKPKPNKPATANSANTAKPKNAKAKKEDAVQKLFKDQEVPTDELTAWSLQTLKGNPNLDLSNIDAPTFIGFLADVDCPLDVQEYAKNYLGNSSEAVNFAQLFVEKRSFLRNASKKKETENLWGPAAAVNPKSGKETKGVAKEPKSAAGGKAGTAAGGTGTAEADGKAAKGKKKKKMQKVSAGSLINFSIQAASDRFNIGEIENP